MEYDIKSFHKILDFFVPSVRQMNSDSLEYDDFEALMLLVSKKNDVKHVFKQIDEGKGVNFVLIDFHKIEYLEKSNNKSIK